MGADSSGMGFQHWVKFCAETPALRVSDVVGFSSGGNITAAEAHAYDAPFPDDSYMAGGRQFPTLVPIMPDDPAIGPNRAAWRVLAGWHKPFLTAFTDSDPVTAGMHVRFQETVPGASSQQHVTIAGAGLDQRLSTRRVRKVTKDGPPWNRPNSALSEQRQKATSKATSTSTGRTDGVLCRGEKPGTPTRQR